LQLLAVGIGSEQAGVAGSPGLRGRPRGSSG